jgi:hypothetical protein
MTVVKDKKRTARIASMALAKIAFCDGETLLASGDVEGAIPQFREAINFDDQNDHYYYQLAMALARRNDSRAEAIEMLQKAITLNPDKAEYLEKLEQLQKNVPEKAVAIEEINNLNTKVKIVPTQYKRTRTRSVKQLLTKRSEQVGKLVGFKLTAIIILVLLSASILLSISWSYKNSRIEITPLWPKDQAALNPSQIEFRWLSSTESVDYLLQLETNGEKVIERYTREKMYTLTREELGLIKPNYHYRWRVIPVSPKRQPVDYKTVDREFKVSIK